MQRTRFHRWPCPVARSTDLLGDWWTPIIMRDAFFGSRRFEQFQQNLGISRATLNQRLKNLVAEGMLDKVPYQERPLRHEYHLTDKGRAFFDVLASLWRFGDDWLFRRGYGPVRMVDSETGAEIRPVVVDEATGKRLDLRRLRVEGRDPGVGEITSPSGVPGALRRKPSPPQR